jgi:glycosyltransferase involved in cell wall biosynthesis
MQPEISVILPLYNAEGYIKEAIDSLLVQTFKNFELIIINDGSTDNSLEIVQQFQDERIILINQENKGLAKTLNIALSKCRSNLVARMDADDVCLPNRLQIQYNSFKSNPNLILLGGAVIYIDEKGDVINRSYPILGTNAIKNFLFNKGNVLAHPTVMFKKDIALKAGGYSEEIGQFFEDHYLWAMMAKHGEFQNLVEPLIQYRLTAQSISGLADIGDGFQQNTLSYIQGKKTSLAFISAHSAALKTLSTTEKNKLFNKRVLILKKNGKKVKLIRNCMFFLPLQTILKMISIIKAI